MVVRVSETVRAGDGRVKRMDLTFWVSLAALLAAVWAVVRAEKFVRGHCKYLRSAEAHMLREGFVRIEGGAYKRTVLSMDGRMDAVDRRLSALEERVADLRTDSDDHHRRLCLIEEPTSQPWPPGVLRTTSTKRAEVRNVERSGE
jgi:hypothetical protein